MLTGHRLTIFSAIICVIFLVANFPVENKLNAFHSDTEIAYFKSHGINMPPPFTIDSNLIFPKATSCEGCHGFDINGNANLDEQGNDVNVHDDWKATMMANSAKDPFWRAKVSHEILVNPNHSLDLQSKCTSCHAPMGHYTAILRGMEHYLMDSLLVDTIGIDGVSCGACHQQADVPQLGSLHSGSLIFDTTRVQYGPYEMPFAPPMDNFVGFKPVYSEHIHDAGICAGCHTLITQTVDLEGNYTGNDFVEQATYHEWLNSDYSNGEGLQTCQNCHMPKIEDDVVISNNYIFLQPQQGFALHEFAGANTFMLQLMKEHRTELGIEAQAENFDSTLAATFRMLQQKSIDLDLELTDLTADTAYFSVSLYNKAGHKFPSGYPSRRAFVEFVVATTEGDTIFHSGILQANYEVEGQDPHYEPHHNVISATEQVQIYEFVIGDVNGNFSTVLERGNYPLKDNRLPPIGFSTSHEVYDTTLIIGNAAMDADFNYIDGSEGSGSDIVHYHIPVTGFSGIAHVSAKVYYQSLPPKWMAEMFAEDTPEINSFKAMYDAADQSPVLVASASLDSLVITGTKNHFVQNGIKVFPNPVVQESFSLENKTEGLEIYRVTVRNLNGQVLFSSNISNHNYTFNLKAASGMYIVEIETNEGVFVEKLLKY